MHLFLRWLVYALGIILVAYLIPGIEVSGLYAALVTVLILGLINVFIRPLLVLLTLPVNILSLGLFTFIINALLLWFASTIVRGFEVSGLGAALWAVIVLWLISWATNLFFKKQRKFFN